MIDNARKGTVTTTATLPPPAGAQFSPQPTTTTTILKGELELGELQSLRSELRIRREELEVVPAKQLLKDLQDDIDELIDTTLANAGAKVGLSGDHARQARKLWARFRAAEDTGFMIEQAITSTPDLKMQTFNLRQFFDTLRKNNTKLAKGVNRSLDLTPGAREKFLREVDELSKLMNTIEIPLTDVAGPVESPSTCYDSDILR